MTDGLLVLNKPSGISSHDVVARARRATGIQKIGHAGTLDPMATGVVVLGVGRATRLIRFVQDREKEYLASIQFGIATATLDAEGIETSRSPMAFDRDDLVKVLTSYRGAIEQIPPMVSALKHEGKRLYEIARAGEEVERPPRQVTIYELELGEFNGGDYPRAEMRVVCSKGTYIRSLADDVASALGGRAHLRALQRTRVGGFELKDAIELDDLSEWRRHLRKPLEAVSELREWQASDAEADAVRHGRRVPLLDQTEADRWAIVDRDHHLLAVYRRRGKEAVAEVVLA